MRRNAQFISFGSNLFCTRLRSSKRICGQPKHISARQFNILERTISARRLRVRYPFALLVGQRLQPCLAPIADVVAPGLTVLSARWALQFFAHGALLPLGNQVTQLYPLATYQENLLMGTEEGDRD